MKLLSLEIFVPSGGNLEIAKELFREIGSTFNWDADDYVGLQQGDCLSSCKNTMCRNSLLILC